MPTVEINDTIMEAEVGERLLDIARRNAAHIGFACDGQGLCTTCECRILSGEEHLSPLSDAEAVWLPPARLRDGYRLGCQVALQSPGPVQALTRAEELRRQLLDVLNPPPGTTAGENLRPLLNNIAMVNWEHIGTFPFNLLRTLTRLGPVRFLWPFHDLNLWVKDTVRVTQHQLREDRILPKQIPAGTTSSTAQD